MDLGAISSGVYWPALRVERLAALVLVLIGVIMITYLQRQPSPEKPATISPIVSVELSLL